VYEILFLFEFDIFIVQCLGGYFFRHSGCINIADSRYAFCCFSNANFCLYLLFCLTVNLNSEYMPKSGDGQLHARTPTRINIHPHLQPPTVQTGNCLYELGRATIGEDAE